MSLQLIPVDFREAAEFVLHHHRHHTPPAGHKFSIGVVGADGRLVGVAIVGRPVSRMRQDGYTLEVTRLCTLDDQPNACSKLYGAACRATFAMGYRRLGTYTLRSEPGTSLRAAGWKIVGEVKARSWAGQRRPRAQTCEPEDRLLWERSA